MSKRLTEAERVVAFFRNSPVEVASTIYDLVRGEMRSRIRTVSKPSRKPRTQRADQMLTQEESNG